MKDGELLEDAMKSQRLATADLLVAAREQGIRRTSDIEYAVLEADGRLAFFPYDGEAGAPEKPAGGVSHSRHERAESDCAFACGGRPRRLASRP